MAREETSKNRQFPVHPLQKALQIVQAIVEVGASRPMDRLLLAEAIKRTPSSSEFRLLLSSSLKYGLTEGTEKADLIKPTQLGLRVAKPVNDTEKSQAMLSALLTPPLFNRIFAHFNKQKLPRSDFLKNVLERQFDVDPSHSAELASLLQENAKYAGVLQSISGAEYINLDLIRLGSKDAPSALDGAFLGDQQEEIEPPADVSPVETETKAEPEKPKRIFVAHGKKHAALKEVQDILDKLKIPYVVAKEEPHAGRPISLKVAETMQQCSAGLFIFTKDEEFRDLEGNPVWRPSENVVFELGAGNVLWGKKIIILKEGGVNFASDYRDLGYITFENGNLGSITMQLFTELIAFELVKVQPA